MEYKNMSIDELLDTYFYFRLASLKENDKKISDFFTIQYNKIVNEFIRRMAPINWNYCVDDEVCYIINGKISHGFILPNGADVTKDGLYLCVKNKDTNILDKVNINDIYPL